MKNQFDIAIIGAGIVGLATSLALTELQPDLQLVVLEKEKKVAGHQTGHNSGVIHSGIYYKPGSLKARLCVEGARRMMDFCDEHSIRYQRIGKVIVATHDSEIARLNTLYERAIANRVPGVVRIGTERLHELEPHASGLDALYSPNTAIVDYAQVAGVMRNLLRQRGVEIWTDTRVTGISHARPGVRIETTQGQVPAKRLINCAGLYADVIARMNGLEPGVRILPFRGEYYLIKPERHNLVNGLIYPVPDPSFPFLGVHFTRTVHDEVEAGPNAVFAFAREGYSLGKVNPAELASSLTYAGFWRMARKYWRTGSYEFYRSLNKRAFVQAMRRLVPEITEKDVLRGGAGVRAQAVTPEGELVDDFKLLETPTGLHVLNAPSPAATASLAIGEYIAARSLALTELSVRADAHRIVQAA